MLTLLRTFALFITFTIVAALGGVVTGLIIFTAGGIFYNTGFQFPVSFYGSIAVIIVSMGKYQLDKSEYKPKPEVVTASAPIPSPRNYRRGPLIVLS